MDIAELENKVKSLEHKINAQYKFSSSVIMFLKDMDLKFEGLVEILEQKDIVTLSEVDAACDVFRGLRVKRNDEVIEKGDIAWVSYKATVDGEEKSLNEEDLPVRVGSNLIAFEEGLLGKRPNSKTTFKEKFEDGDHKEWVGKTVVFNIAIKKVKTLVEKKNG